MGISAMISRNCKQVAVYWGSPQENGYGGKVFADPVELAVRWEDKEQLIQLDDGNQISSRAIVYVLQDVDLEGKMCLGSIGDIVTVDDSVITVDDSTITVDNEAISFDDDKAYIIKKFEKSPVLGSTTEFYRKVWLTPLLT